jgi:phosphatidylserine decarboxylase
MLITLIGLATTALLAWWVGAWAILPGLLTLALLSFYRDPPRAIPPGDRLVLSPADGRIMSIERDWASPDGSRELRICIFLSVANVHVNRSPCAARVRAIEYTPGLFLNAMRPDATTRNENSLMTLDPRGPLPGPIRVRQIAGLLARRIVCAAKAGDELAAGQRFGMIKLGSQTEIRLPENAGWAVRVRSGDHVKGGSTILAELT